MKVRVLAGLVVTMVFGSVVLGSETFGVITKVDDG